MRIHQRVSKKGHDSKNVAALVLAHDRTVELLIVKSTKLIMLQLTYYIREVPVVPYGAFHHKDNRVYFKTQDTHGSFVPTDKRSETFDPQPQEIIP